MASSSAHLLRQPPEVLHAILIAVEPTDLARLSQTCRELRDCIANDYLLWKRLYLQHFDCPASHIEDETADSFWQAQLQDIIRVDKILASGNISLKNEESSLEKVYSAAMALLTEATSKPDKNSAFFARHFARESNIAAFLARSSLFASARYPSNTPASSHALRQASAKLFVYYGLEIEPHSFSVSAGRATAVHPYARSRVYDLRRYTAANHWGPFLDDGSEGIDWEKVQCILIVILYNLRLSRCVQYNHRLCNSPFHGLAPKSFTSVPLNRRTGAVKAASRLARHSSSSSSPSTSSLSSSSASHPNQPSPQDGGISSLAAQDPYGVTGTWMRIVCFLDYSDLYRFNFESPPLPESEARPPIDTREALRLIRLQLHVTKIEWPDDSEDDNEQNNQNSSSSSNNKKNIGPGSRPIVHFEGTSKSTHVPWDPNANSTIRGTVRTTRTGAIRWTTISVFQGEERWRSEAIQIGGIRSGRGAIGSWFDKDYDHHGPVGPTYFWKVSDDYYTPPPRPSSAAAAAAAAASTTTATTTTTAATATAAAVAAVLDQVDHDQVPEVLMALGLGLASNPAGPFGLMLWNDGDVDDVAGNDNHNNNVNHDGEDDDDDDDNDDDDADGHGPGTGAGAGAGGPSILFIIQ